MGTAPSEGRPTLAFVYEPGSFATLALARAASGVCDLVWVADHSRPDVAEVAALLRRFGRVVDTAGLDVAATASAIAQESPDGILALADDALCFTAEVAAELGLAFHDRATALRLTDKFAQREALAAGGLPTPGCWVVPADAPDAVVEQVRDEARFPVVCKPRRGEGSRDTVPVAEPGGLASAVERILGDAARDLVVEEYIHDAAEPLAGEGFAGYVSVESIVAPSGISHLAVNGRTPPAHPFRETGFFIPAALAPGLEEGVLAAAEAAAEALGVTTGCLHTEIKLSPDGPVVIEVNGRVGGGVPELLEAAAGVALLPLALRLALGEDVVIAGPLPTRCVAFLMYVQAPPQLTEVTSVEGLDALRGLAGVQEVVLRRGPGARVDWREGNHGHVLSVFGTAPDHAALRRSLAAVVSTVTIEGR